MSKTPVRSRLSACDLSDRGTLSRREGLGLLGGAWLAGVKPHYPDIPYSEPIGMGLFMCTAWFAVFLVQFVAAPPRLASAAHLDEESGAPGPARASNG